MFWLGFNGGDWVVGVGNLCCDFDEKSGRLLDLFVGWSGFFYCEMFVF